MKIRHFDLEGARKNLSSGKKSSSVKFTRRQFVKTLGVGAVAVYPSADILQSVLNESFTIHKWDKGFQVVRYGKVVWDVQPAIFAPGAQISIVRQPGEWQISLTGASYPGTAITFDFVGRIFQANGKWKLEMEVQPFGIRTAVSFPEFLDRKNPLRSEFEYSGDLCSAGQGGSVSLKGKFQWQLSADWQMTFVSPEGIHLDYCERDIQAHQLIMLPYNGNNLGFLDPVENAGTLLSIPDSGILTRISGLLTYRGKRHFRMEESRKGISLFLGETTSSQPVNVLWGETAGKEVWMNGFSGEEIALGSFFFSALFSREEPPRFYAAASIKEKGYWLNNPLGSFRLVNQADFPDYEAFGMEEEIEESYFEPRMKAFIPRIDDAQCLAVSYKDPPSLFFEDQQPVKRTINPAIKRVTVPATTTQPTREEQKKQEETPQERVTRPKTTIPVKVQEKEEQDPVRKPAREASRMEIGYNDIRFRPNKTLSVRVLRPEDLIWLEFDFQNFVFSNKGQAPFLELSNPKEAGIIIIRFPSQHTLEQAFFETTLMDPSGGNETIDLPAKQMRAKKSRLVYELEAGHPGFELTMNSLLDWSKFKLRVHPRAWIKLPQIMKVDPVSFSKLKTEPVSKQQPRTIAPVSRDYSVKMVQFSRNKTIRRSVYDENQLKNVLAPEALSTLQPNFDISKLKVDMKTGPIPDLSTSIEAPALMYISPNQVNDFTHRIELKLENTEEVKTVDPMISTQFRTLDPLVSNKGEVTELWHTALGVKLQQAGISPVLLPSLKTIRALWAFDANPDVKGCAPIDQPFQASLDANDRHKLVHTTSNYEIQGFSPLPVPVKKLMLTTLGAYLDWHAFFDVPSPTDTYLNVIEWEHLATLGRDHYVKIVREGYLFPFGHRAALVKVTERKFNSEKKAAVNMMRMYIVVLQKEVLYARNDPDGKFIRFPFQAVRIENDKTPNIDKPDNIPLSSGKTFIPVIIGKPNPCSKPGRSSTYNFYINVGQKGFPFDITVTDKEGEEHAIRMPLAFVENVVGRTQSMVNAMVTDYNGKVTYNTTPFSGQDVAYAECLVDGDTAFETESMKFGAMYYPAKGEADLKFHPVMQESAVFIKQVNELTGNKKATSITLEDDANQGYVFAKVISESAVDFSGGSDKAGGFLTPNMAITGLSKLQGPIGGDIENLKKLVFDASDFFKSIPSLPSAKIFGIIDIFSLIGVKDMKGSFDGMIAEIKKVREEIERIKNLILLKENEARQTGANLKAEIDNLQAQIKAQLVKLLNALNSNVPKAPNLKTWFTDEAFYAEYKWKPDLNSETKGIEGVLDVKVNDPAEALQIVTTLKKPYDATLSPTLTGDAKFSDFRIELLGKLAVKFGYVQFKTGTSGKTDVKVDMGSPPIEFIGELAFVNNLQSIIPSTGFSEDGPYVDVSTSGVTAGFNISVPNVTVGVCTLSNISLGAAINLPFTGKPLTISFNFCTRQNPFLLTVMIYGGGGYFLLKTSLKELVSVEAAFEFGAAAALDIGVASGSVSIMGGFYFKYEVSTKTVTLTGYIRINGRLSILGIITVSLEFYLALTYVKGPKVSKLEGEATLKVKIEIFCFSKTVSCSVRRTLAGADSDPTFAQMMELDDWQQYCLAFAEN